MGITAQERQARGSRTRRVAGEPGRHDVLTRRTLLALGWTDRGIAHQVATGRWCSLFDGVVLVHPGPPGRLARLRAASLAAGRGGLLTGRAGAFLIGLDPDPADVVDVRVPHDRTPAPRPGIRFHRTRRAVPSRRVEGIPVASVEEVVLDLLDWAGSAAEAVEWITRACSQRRTTPERLLAAGRRRRAMRHRRELIATCAEVAAGVLSPLERWHAVEVVAAHGLPPGRRQVRRRHSGRTTYSDVEVAEYGVVTELDGRLGHEDPPGRWRDMARDNEHLVQGRVTLRFGWADVTGSACWAAEQTARVLAARGWGGRPRPCGPDCRLRWQAAA